MIVDLSCDIVGWPILPQTAIVALVDMALKSVIIFTAAAGAVICMGRCSAAARHLVWFLALASLPFLPLLSRVLPGWQSLPQWMGPQYVQPAAGPEAAATPASSPRNLPQIKPVEAFTANRPGDAPGPNERQFASLATREVPWTVRPTAEQLSDTQRRFNFHKWALLAWLAGVLCALVPMFLGLLSLQHLGRSSLRETSPAWLKLLEQLLDCLRMRGSVTLLQSKSRRMPMTWGWLRPRVLLPEESHSWPTEQRRAVLLHELAHVKRWDYLTHLFSQIVCALYWFNPLVWMAARQLATERELACDDIVLSQGTKPADYAEHVLQIAARLPIRRSRAFGAVAIARPSTMEKRVLAILDNKRNRAGLTRYAVLLILALLAAAVIPVSMMQAVTPQTGSPAIPASATDHDEMLFSTNGIPPQKPSEPLAVVAVTNLQPTITQILPKLSQLGTGWASNQVITLVDPRCSPNEQVSLPRDLEMMKKSDREAYAFVRYFFGTNRCFLVFINRFNRPEDISGDWGKDKDTEDTPGSLPKVGEEVRFSQRQGVHDDITFRRDRYLINVESVRGHGFDQLKRLAELLDHNLFEAQNDLPSKVQEPNPQK